jgi:N-methylhydantoinase A
MVTDKGNMLMRSSATRVATDVGGTFTDLVFLQTDRETGRQTIRIAKADTTPPNFERGVLNVLTKANTVLGDVDSMVHGTTVIINALTERKGAKVGLITTRGFRDSLEIARGNRPDFFNLRYEKPAPFVPRHLRREVSGRINYKGEETAPLDLSTVGSILDDFRAEGVEAVAICFINSYTNPDHEKTVLALVREMWPQVSAVASHEITREWREYERTNTAVLSAYVQPVAANYLGRLKEGLDSAGFVGRLNVMQSNCGVDTIEATSRIPITMVESGPASGFWGAAALGRLIGEPNVLALDIGGTTAKCSLIRDGQVKITSDYWIERDARSSGYPIMVPVVDLVEIGNGGGSIARVNEFGKLHVGPRSAGANPGPAAYGRGGTSITTTDANLALGRINRDYFCGGEVVADMAAVERGLQGLSTDLSLSPIEVARGIVRIANNNMINALKLVSLNRGYDPRDFTLVAFGGGGGMHAAALGKELNVRKVVVPAGAAVFSAWGMMLSDLRRDYLFSRLAELGPDIGGLIAEAVGQIESEALAQFASEGIDSGKVRFERHAKLRYQNQENAVEVDLDGVDLDAGGIAELGRRFTGQYEREYSYTLDTPLELVGLHVTAFAEIDKLEMTKAPVTGRSLEQALKGRRDVDYATEGVHRAAIYDNLLLEPGMSFAGPAVIEDSGTTILVHPGQKVTVDDYSSIHIEMN